MNAQLGPLSGPPPREVPLPEAPLVRVLAQVRFPIIARIENQEYIGGFQEQMRGVYPVLRSQQSQDLTLSPAGVQSSQTRLIWRFIDPKSGWKVTLAPDFLALETTQYTSRADFVSRLQSAVDALATHMNPAVVDRIGVRYIDRVSGQPLDEFSSLVRREMGGVLTTQLGKQTIQAVSDCLFEIPDESGRMRARWGLLPPGTTVDPGALEPISSQSWFLDIDAFKQFSDGAQEFEADKIAQDARALASRVYSLFRWIVTDEFLRHYGGEP